MKFCLSGKARLSFSGGKSKGAAHNRLKGHKCKCIERVVKREIREGFEELEYRLRKTLVRAVREEIFESQKELLPVIAAEVRSAVQQAINQTVPQIVRTELESVLYSPQFAEYLTGILSPGAGFGQIAREYLGQEVEITTTGGTVTGTLTEVNVDYVVVEESPNSQVIVPFSGAISIGAA
ncbi:DUF2642 domain-containing protein [Brevibacillus fluminis]|uniref:DUF2642 domain-containing protein n=1 Tax=Brevibacillus fluminis TaxID=511487 RepID=UPI003F8ADBE6